MTVAKEPAKTKTHFLQILSTKYLIILAKLCKEFCTVRFVSQASKILHALSLIYFNPEVGDILINWALYNKVFCGILNPSFPISREIVIPWDFFI